MVVCRVLLLWSSIGMVLYELENGVPLKITKYTPGFMSSSY